MKITQDDIVDRQTVVHIELEDDDLDPYLDRGYRRVVQRVQIPGFRKGKAPRRIVQQFLGRESLLNEVLDTMLPELTSRAIEEQELDAAGLPQMEMVDLEPVESGDDQAALRALIEDHYRLTGSANAERVLGDWRNGVRNFVKVMPREYKRALADAVVGEREVPAAANG